VGFLVFVPLFFFFWGGGGGGAMMGGVFSANSGMAQEKPEVILDSTFLGSPRPHSTLLFWIFQSFMLPTPV